MQRHDTTAKSIDDLGSDLINYIIRLLIRDEPINSGHTHRDANAFICTSRKVRDASLRLAETDKAHLTLDAYLKSHSAVQKALQAAPGMVKNFSRLKHRLCLFKEDANQYSFHKYLKKKDVMCLSGDDDVQRTLIEAMPMEKSVAQKRLFYFLLLSENTVSLAKFMFRFKIDFDSFMWTYDSSVENIIYNCAINGSSQSLRNLLFILPESSHAKYLEKCFDVRHRFMMHISWLKHGYLKYRSTIQVLMPLFIKHNISDEVKAAFNWACKSDNTELAACILQNNAPFISSVKISEALDYIARYNSIHLLKYLFQLYPDIYSMVASNQESIATCMLIAAAASQNDCTDIITYLLDELKIDVNSRAYYTTTSILHFACKNLNHHYSTKECHGRITTLNAILKHKPDLEYIDPGNDYTPLQSLGLFEGISRYGELLQTELIMADILIHAGASVTFKGTTALHKVDYFHLAHLDLGDKLQALLTLIIQHGGSMNAVDKYGDTPYAIILHNNAQAFFKFQHKIIPYLPDEKIDMSITANHEAVTVAYQYAKENNHHLVLDYLRRSAPDYQPVESAEYATRTCSY